MFERYTEKARRVIFFARYEANQLGSSYIEPEHILLGFLREEKAITNRWLSATQVDSIRREIQGHSLDVKPVPSLVDLPLTSESTHVLAYAVEEADRAGDRHIGSVHLLLGLLREKRCFAAELLRDHGLDVEQLREELSRIPVAPAGPLRIRHFTTLDTVEIHGQSRSADFLRRAVKQLREIPWHWEKRDWAPSDIVVHRKTQTISFDINLGKDEKHFDLIPNGWGKDYCKICHWELYPATDAPDHATGYTNGRDWICTECYDKFIARSDFFSSNYPDIT